MATSNYLLPDPVYAYLSQAAVSEPDILRDLREETARRPDASWSSPPELGQFLYLLVKMTCARTILELGTFTGYGALWMALALPADGRLTAIDVNEDAHRLGLEYWAKAGVADRIRLLAGEVRDHLPIVAEELRGALDLAFIDADKPGYGDYYDTCIELLRPGGVMVFDNVLQRGAVVDPAAHPDAKNAAVMRAFNDRLAQDSRIDLTILPVADGILLARKK